jgi:hypothetical protein
MDHDAQKPMLPQFVVEKHFPQRGYLCHHRLFKRTAFTCNRYGLGKTSKLVAFAVCISVHHGYHYPGYPYPWKFHDYLDNT